MQSIEDKILSSIKKCGIVPRYSKADVSYASMPDGRRLSETVEGYVAIIFQHECDHLDGILYTDRADTVFVSQSWADERSGFGDLPACGSHIPHSPSGFRRYAPTSLSPRRRGPAKHRMASRAFGPLALFH